MAKRPNEPGLLEWAARRARSTDPWTSRAAAKSVEPILTEIQAQVMRYALERGADGFTDVQLTLTLGDGGSTYRTRRAELVAAGLIADTGRVMFVRMKRAHTIWAITAQGIQFMKDEGTA